MSLASVLSGPTGELAECVIEIEDAEIRHLYPYVEQVEVDCARGQADVCKLELRSFRDDASKWLVQDDAAIRPWRKLRVDAMFGRVREPVFRGYVKQVVANYPASGGEATVEVHAQDESLLFERLTLYKTQSTIDAPRTDQQIITELLGKLTGAKLRPRIPASGLTNSTLMQAGSASSFIRERADANGFEFYVRDGELYWGPPELDGKPQPTILVYAGTATNCVDFVAEFDGHLPDAVRIVQSGEDGQPSETIFEPNLPLLGKQPASSDDRGLDPFVWTMPTSGGSAAEQSSAAQAKANECAWKLRATGELDGDRYGHVLRTHALVTVDGVGDTYGGIWYVDQVIHTFARKGYRQRFRLLRNAAGATQ